MRVGARPGPERGLRGLNIPRLERHDRRLELNEGLLAPPGGERAKSGAAVDGRADVVAVAELGLAGVDADLDGQRAWRRPVLGGGR